MAGLQDTKICQLYEDLTATASSAAGTTVLPNISDRPDSAARTSRIRTLLRLRAGSIQAGTAASSSSTTTTTTTSSSAASASQSTTTTTSSGSSTTTNTSQPTIPLSPQQVLERYRRYLTPYELEEIKKYPQIYYFGHTAQKIQAVDGRPNNAGYDDEKGRYKCIRNDHINYRYEVLKGLGKGSFGDVVKTYDHKTKKNVAVKIIRNEKRFHKQAQTEIKLLEQLRRQDKHDTHNIIHMTEYFLFRNHLCIAFELLHQDLYSALKKNDFKGFKLDEIRQFTANLLQCLRVLRRAKIIHCDLKPENILLKSKTGTDIKVIDFGSSCLENERVHTYIQSRFYRAPEVILNAGYGTPIDMWSLGCILAELYTGEPLLPGHDEKEQLMYQMEMLGVPSADFLLRGKRTAVFFDPDNRPRYLTDRKGRQHLPGTRSIAEALGGGHIDADLIDFIRQCLVFDPRERMTPRQAMKHPFVASASGVLGSSLAESLFAALPAVPTLPSARPKRLSVASCTSTASGVSQPASGRERERNNSAPSIAYPSQASAPQSFTPPSDEDEDDSSSVSTTVASAASAAAANGTTSNQQSGSRSSGVNQPALIATLC